MNFFETSVKHLLRIHLKHNYVKLENASLKVNRQKIKFIDSSNQRFMRNVF